ncbi:MAG TPA: methionyl-tRNA formyltransferase [Chlamydiales bacterium]|jgi:methionyl-tRNA formyltransferase
MFPRIVFFGTPVFAAQVLEALVEAGVPIVGIVTQPDRPKGRSGAPTPSEVKGVAEAKLKGVPLLQPVKSSNAGFLAELKALNADLYVVVAFGQILPQSLLDIPLLGCINVHASLLPKYRGAAPMQRALMHGEKQTGVAIQKMVKELDAGNVIACSKVDVPEETTFGELYQALCDLSKPLLLSVLKEYARGVPPATPQDSSQITFAPKILPEETSIQWKREARELHNQIRALSPRPGAWCWVGINGEKKRLKIFRTKIIAQSGSPGQVLPLKDFVVACGNESLQLIELQPEGKPRMRGSDWARGLKTPPEFFS